MRPSRPRLLLNLTSRIHRVSHPTASTRRALTSVSPAARMPRLNPLSQTAIDRLRNYTPPPTSYEQVPLSRRAAVLVLLYADRTGELRVVLTMRAKTLSSYAGQAALPGGRADTLSETPFQTARREAHEEIGLPQTDSEFPRPFRVEHLCELPANLARTELVVRPCVALLHSYDETTGENADPEVSLIPRLDAREVAAVFTASFRDFLRMKQDTDSEWYRGAWTEWHESRWRMHQFFVPVRPEEVVKPRPETQERKQVLGQLENLEKAASAGVARYRVWGMTARIMVDVARVAYALEPEFEHNSHFGDEAMISRLRLMGRLSAVRRKGDQLTSEDMKLAAKLS
ncbi:NUDIX hydrolase [Aspergillus homomorphus CBS 101889]|uniref:NUDIX domain protein n=1 Tax=Aspergillus homomorphus (strain CBS 101889) TaxID=1450537 RepID=A0A395HWM1_ASPHC|nr:NUDIX domain protein [Aspergillus homomorphus CBS 101889]RAL12301.1 NUDIX domain protein [Aspergillus homomorphus CBS 101889]